RRWPAVLALVAALVTLVPIVIGVAITAAKPGPAAASGAGFKPDAQTSTPSAPAPAADNSRRHARQPCARDALLQHATPMHTSPDCPTLAPLPLKTEFGSPQALWVVRRSGSWLGVVSPLAGNGKLGWIEQSTAKLGRVTWQIKVS